VDSPLEPEQKPEPGEWEGEWVLTELGNGNGWRDGNAPGTGSCAKGHQSEGDGGKITERFLPVKSDGTIIACINKPPNFFD
jgi:hypothetical protein